MKYSNTALANAATRPFPWLQKHVITLVLVAAALVAMFILMPFSPVPTGTRGVITQFGAIQGIVNEGLTFVPSWR